jgi:hypothetical protein
MRSILTAAATAAFCLTGALPVSAADDLKPLSLAKECSKFTGKPGDYCTITASNFGAVPVGARVIYYGPVIGPVILASAILIDAGDGNTAIGSCNVNLPKSAGTCTFWAGSGTLAGFQAIVTLTIDNKGLFHWDGGYSM